MSKRETLNERFGVIAETMSKVLKESPSLDYEDADIIKKAMDTFWFGKRYPITRENCIKALAFVIKEARESEADRRDYDD